MNQKSDQWDIRINIEDEEHLTDLRCIVENLWESGRCRFLSVSNVESGEMTDETRGVDHVHIALCLVNPTSYNSVKKLFITKKVGYYIAPRDKSKPIAKWIEYHGKPHTKLNPNLPFLFKAGVLPKDKNKRIAEAIEEDEQEAENPTLAKRRKDWARKKQLILCYAWDQLDNEFPGFIYTSMGQSMKRELLKQKSDEYTAPLKGDLENYIIYGDSGTGKSSSVQLLYPNCYKKMKGTPYWDGYDKTNPDHQVVWIDELSKETLDTLTGKQAGGFDFLKELGDRYAVTVDEKYTKGFKIRPKKIIITMNEHPCTLLPDRATHINKKALYRKFKIMHVSDWLFMNGLVNSPTKGAKKKELSTIQNSPTESIASTISLLSPEVEYVNRFQQYPRSGRKARRKLFSSDTSNNSDDIIELN